MSVLFFEIFRNLVKMTRGAYGKVQGYFRGRGVAEVEGMWPMGRGCGPGERGVTQGVWQAGLKNYKKYFFFKILKNRHNTKVAKI